MHGGLYNKTKQFFIVLIELNINTISNTVILN